MNAKTIILPLAAMLLAATCLSAQTPLPMRIPDAPKNAVTQNGTQIEKIVHTPDTTLKVVQFPKRFGADYTLSLWVKLNDSPALLQGGFTSEAPPTIIDMHSGKSMNDQRCLIRVHNGQFVITELLEGPNTWKALEGSKPKAEPGKWYHLAYSRTKAKGTLYVNGSQAAQTSASAIARQEKLQNIIFGRFHSMRRLDGTILQPRIYPKAFTPQQIQDLYSNPPAEAK